MLILDNWNIQSTLILLGLTIISYHKHSGIYSQRELMFVIKQFSKFHSNTVGVEYVFELFNPAGIVECIS